MFDVLAFVYENYWAADSCPELPALHRKLHSVGFEHKEVTDALLWLEELKGAARAVLPRRPPAAPALATDGVLQPVVQPPWRLLTAQEKWQLGTSGWGFITFMAHVGALPSAKLELVLERALAAPISPLSLEDVKLIVLMVYWSLGEEPDALILDELCDQYTVRMAH